jgi:hydroxymethylbilane synthase
MKVFISRKRNQVEALCHELEAAGYEVDAISMIRTEAVAMPEKLPETDWIFFSSAESVHFFFEKYGIVANRKFGAVGESTATKLSRFVRVDFIGNASDIEKTADDFAKLTNGKTALFPGAEQSLRSIQKHKPNHEVIDLTCYRTIAEPVQIDGAQVLVFSSPSNVASFFRINDTPKNAVFIAFGQSTAGKLNEYGISNAIIPESLSASVLANTIKAHSKG